MALRRALRAAALLAVMVVLVIVPRPALASSDEIDKSAKGDGVGKDEMYFFVPHKGPKRCFVMTVGRWDGMGIGVPFHVHYDFPDAAEGTQIQLELRPLSLESTPKTRFSLPPVVEVISDAQGSVQFLVKTSGYYSLCAVQTKTTTGRALRLSLDVDLGHQDRMYDKAKSMFSLGSAEILMVQLKNKAKEIRQEADVMHEMEMNYHKELIQLKREVLWWPVMQVLILVATGYYQVRHLKQFFQSKRLV